MAGFLNYPAYEGSHLFMCLGMLGARPYYMHRGDMGVSLLDLLDPVLSHVFNKRHLHLYFPKVRRENVILWLLGFYLEYI